MHRRNSTVLSCRTEFSYYFPLLILHSQRFYFLFFFFFLSIFPKSQILRESSGLKSGDNQCSDLLVPLKKNNWCRTHGAPLGIANHSFMMKSWKSSFKKKSGLIHIRLMSLATTSFCDITTPKTRPQYPLRVVVRTARGNPPRIPLQGTHRVLHNARNKTCMHRTTFLSLWC